MPRLSYPHHEMEFATYRSHPPLIYPVAHHPSSSSTLLQRLGIEKLEFDTNNLLQFQQFIRYSEPLELNTIASSYGPLDLSVKNSALSSSSSLTQIPITPPCTPSPNKIKNSPQRSPTPDEEPSKNKKFKFNNNNNNNNSPSPTKKTKATRKLNFDEDNSSPVSGTIIRELRPDETLVVRKGDIDPAFNVVEITDEAKAELAKIENHIGDYVCRLCKELYEDAFGLAQHRCSRIVHVEYRCPECDKVFNCPANLASHRRWHKPRPHKESKLIISTTSSSSSTAAASKETGIINLTSESISDSAEQFSCNECGKRFRRIAYLRKHQTLHQMD